MKCRPLLWTWILVPVSAIWLVVAGIKMAEIERDVTRRGAEALTAAGHGWARIEADVRTLHLLGEAPDQAARRDAVALLTAVGGVRDVADESKLAGVEAVGTGDGAAGPEETASATAALAQSSASDDTGGSAGSSLAGAGTGEGETDAETATDEARAATGERSAVPGRRLFRVVIEKQRDTVGLSGAVPYDGDKLRLAEAVAGLMPGATLESDLAAGAEAPESWLLAINFGLVQLTGLESGRFELRGNDMRLQGRARDGDTAFKLKARAQNGVPEGFMLSAYQITAPKEGPFLWHAERRAGRLTLGGGVGGEEGRNRLLASAGKSFGGFEITDSMEIAADPPAGWEAAALVGLAQLRRLSTGQIRLLDTHLEIEGEVYTEMARADVRAQLKKTMPAGFTATEKVVVKDSRSPLTAAQCREAITEVLVGANVSFARASEVILPESHEALDQVAHLAKRCPSAAIEVAGHTDSRGDPELNRSLSRHRAESVVTYLVEAGVPEERLNAVGYGADRPIADNRTEEGRARNRRIEFAVRQAGDG